MSQKNVRAMIREAYGTLLLTMQGTANPIEARVGWVEERNPASVTDPHLSHEMARYCRASLAKRRASFVTASYEFLFKSLRKNHATYSNYFRRCTREFVDTR